MKISASISSHFEQQKTSVQTDGSSRKLHIEPKSTGYGSSVNGGELLVLALATCFCNDIYREAAKRNITVTGVEVECSATFGSAGETGYDFQYKTKIESDSPIAEIEELIRHTDGIAEIHNTLRKGVNITLVR